MLRGDFAVTVESPRRFISLFSGTPGGSRFDCRKSLNRFDLSRASGNGARSSPPMNSRNQNQQENRNVLVLPDQSILVEYGPMRLTIRAFEGSTPVPDLALQGSEKAFQVLEEQARFLPVLKKMAHAITLQEDFPEVVFNMIDAAQKMDEQDLTPMAAVAGAASDAVADFLIGLGGTKILVDNGGDIALRMKEGEMATVGIKTGIDAREPAFLLLVRPPLGVGGIATSGLGGRSFTKGIASAATILAGTACLADAAATIVANFTNVNDPHINRGLAETLYPDTDIAGQWVTTKVGRLSAGRIDEALNHGLAKAHALCQRGLIKGAFITVKGKSAWTASIGPWLRKR
jgi:uncharacterized protein